MTGQQKLFAHPVDERRLGDTERTILEAIDQRGSLTAREAGTIAYRLRGWESLITVPRAWVTSAGARALNRLEHHGLVRRQRGRWRRRTIGGAA